MINPMKTEYRNQVSELDIVPKGIVQFFVRICAKRFVADGDIRHIQANIIVISCTGGFVDQPNPSESSFILDTFRQCFSLWNIVRILIAVQLHQIDNVFHPWIALHDQEIRIERFLFNVHIVRKAQRRNCP